MNTAGAGLAFTAARSWSLISRPSRPQAPLGVPDGDLGGEQEQQRRPPLRHGPALAEHLLDVARRPRQALRRQELLEAQVIEGGPLVRPRQQQAGAGQQLLAPHGGFHLVAFVGGVQLGEAGEQPFRLDPADLGGGSQPRRARAFAGVHAERDRLQPPLDRIALAGVARITVVQHVADDALVELVAVLGQPAAAVVEDAERRQQHRVFDQRGQIVAAADRLDQARRLLGLAEGVKPAGDEQVLQRLRQRFERRRSAAPGGAGRPRRARRAGW